MSSIFEKTDMRVLVIFMLLALLPQVASGQPEAALRPDALPRQALSLGLPQD